MLLKNHRKNSQNLKKEIHMYCTRGTQSTKLSGSEKKVPNDIYLLFSQGYLEKQNLQNIKHTHTNRFYESDFQNIV